MSWLSYEKLTIFMPLNHKKYVSHQYLFIQKSITLHTAHFRPVEKITAVTTIQLLMEFISTE